MLVGPKILGIRPKLGVIQNNKPINISGENPEIQATKINGKYCKSSGEAVQRDNITAVGASLAYNNIPAFLLLRKGIKPRE